MTLGFTVKDLTINYTPDLDGGGTYIGKDFLNVLSHRYPGRKFNRCLEWCSGPGFIGFSLLLNDYCNSLCLIDSYLPALECAENSVANTNYQVTTYHISSLQNLPNSEKFDLVVANPPHFPYEIYWQEFSHQNNKRIYLDPNWEIHNDFFKYIKSHLADDGVIILQESQWGCNVDTFKSILDVYGLTIKDSYPEYTKHTYPVFYLEITHK